jgi:broad specificity phosphatase PhoE
MSGRLILVKHARPVIEPGGPPSTWRFSEAGRMAAGALAAKLARFTPARLVASPEPKALATAQAIGAVLSLPVATDPGLVEHRADSVPFLEEDRFLALVERMFAAPDRLVMGEETGKAARARFAAAMTRISGDGTRVIVAHGRVITLWLSHRLGLEPMPFWRSLGLASAAVLSEDGERLEAIESA